MIIVPPDWFHYKPLAVAGSPYHFGLGGADSLQHSAQFTWDSAFVGTITFWTKLYPNDRVSLTDATAGRWIQQQPGSLYIPISPVGSATNVNMTITIPGGGGGGAAGGCEVDLSGFGAAYWKAIVTVTTQGEFTYFYGGKR